MIKHLKPRSRWEILYNRIKDIPNNIFKKRKKRFAQFYIGRPPMQKPTGTIFYLDYVYNGQVTKEYVDSQIENK